MIDLTPRRIAVTACAVSALAWIGVSIGVGPAAGTEIVNQATVSYTDTQGRDQVTTTNEVVLVVQQVYSATIERDRVLTAAPGQDVRFLHTLTNTGNGPDNYTISVAQDNANGLDDGDFDSITVYHDLNNNGQVDAGEPVLASTLNGGSITLDADESANLIVLASVPAGAVADDVFDLTLTAQAEQGDGIVEIGSVQDLTVGQGVDGLDDTNEDRVVVTDDAVLVVTKSSVLDAGDLADPNDDTITYTVTVENVGLTRAIDNQISDALPAETTFDSTFNGGVIDSTDATAFDAPTAGVDDGQNGQPGALPTHAAGTISGEIDELLPGASVDFTYRVTINVGVEAGTEINNVATVTGDYDDDGVADDPVDSNETKDLVPAIYGVVITDTGTEIAFDPVGAPTPGVNDGADDDAANDIQHVDAAPQGADVIFTNVVTNAGNVTDNFNLELLADGFPPGTVFRFFAADGFTPLLDTTSDGIPDTGPLDPAEQRAIVVKATLPPGAVVNAPVTALVQAESTEDPALNPVADTVTERLVETLDDVVDIANSTGATGLGDPLVDADPASAVTTTLTGAAGTEVVFDLFVNNEGSAHDTYALAAFADAAGTTPLPDWLRIEFRNLAGDVISNLSGVAPGAQVAFQAAAILAEDAPSTATQPIFFSVSSPSSGADNVKQDAVTVAENESIKLTAGQRSTVSPCSAAIYAHNVTNTGGTPEDVVISITAQTRWSSVLLYPTAIDGAEPSGYTLSQSLNVGDDVTVLDASTGTLVLRPLVTDGAGGIAVNLDPQDTVIVRVQVQVPCDAAEGAVDNLTLQATVVDGVALVTNTDETTASNSHLQLTKLGALDADCDGTPDGAPGTQFATAQVAAAPDTCVIWEVTATNRGTRGTCDVIIYDAAPAFTTLELGSTVISAEPAPGTGACTESAPNVNCTVGNPFDNDGDGTDEAFCLRAGESAAMRFQVRVE